MIALLLVLGVVGAREVTLDEALDLAGRSAVEVRVADLEADAARARVGQVRSYYLPTVTARGAALWWDDAVEAELISPDACINMEAAYQGICDQFVGAFSEEPIVIREAQTQQVSVEAKQPITGLWGVAEGHRATRSLASAARLDAERQRERTAVQVVDAWLMALRARRMAEVAAGAVSMLEVHSARAAAFHDAGIIGENEVLQVDVALSRARVDLRRAEVGVHLAERALAVVTGADEPRLQPVSLDVGGLPAVPTDLSATPVDARADVAAMEARLDAAQANRQAKRADLLPQVAGVGKWTRSWGVGSLAAGEEYYVGLGMEWEVLGWGRRSYAAREATFQARQAEEGLRGLREASALQAESAIAEAGLAREAWEASRVTVQQADANREIVRARFEAHTLATADLLEAETLYQAAQADEIGAYFDCLAAIARAQEALGRPVRPL